MLELKNEFIFAPIKLGYTKGDGIVNEKHIAFYEKRCKYLGAVIPEPLYIDKGLREIPTQLGIDDDDKIEGLKKLTDSMHKFDTKVIAHLNHPGRMANPKIPGNYFVSSTDKPCENGGASPKRMDKQDMEQAIKLFTDAAKRAEKAGFDIIELQFGHGYLLAQFMSGFVNDRDDEYGETFENRIKFPLEVFDAVKNAVKLPIIVRLSGDEMIPKGIKIEESIKLAQILKERGVSAIHVSAGTVCSTPPWYFQHMFVPKGKTWEMAQKIKNGAGVPVIAVGRIGSFEDVEKVKNEFKADFVAIGRALVADSDFVGKYLKEVEGILRPCLACAQGCLGSVKAGKGLQCLINPEVGIDSEIFEKAQKAKKYAVVGGGPAGMEAAITLSDRGHSVDLFEKDKLGGQFIFAPLTPHKQSMGQLLSYFTEELKNKGVNIIKKEATEDDLINGYDGVILATGAKPSIPAVDGLKKFYWAEILLEENMPENKTVLIMGGGLIGVDIATALIEKNNKVIIVKRTTDFGEDMEAISKALSLKAMKEKGVVFSDHTHIQKIDGTTVYALRDGKEIKFENVDIIVVSTGMKSYDPLSEKLKNKVNFYVVGDAKEVGNAQAAIKNAYEIAKNL